jgi:hypothetical protein
MSVVSEGKTASILFTIKDCLSARNDSFFRDPSESHRAELRAALA